MLGFASRSRRAHVKYPGCRADDPVMSIAESQAPPVEAEVGVSAAVFADKWGAVRLGRFADRGPTRPGLRPTNFGAGTR